MSTEQRGSSAGVISPDEEWLMKKNGWGEQEILQWRKEKKEKRKAEVEHTVQLTGLDHDSFNEWVNLYYVTSEKIADLAPRHSYEEYVRNTNKDQELIEFILRVSKPEAVKDFDDLANEFNNDLDRIKREGDLVAVKIFFERSRSLIKGK
jgi:hypothetical protein